MSDTQCPECMNGKCVNCVNEAWDFHKDEPVPCGCLHLVKERLRNWVEQWVSDYYDPVIDPDIHDDLRRLLDMEPVHRSEP